ncbi:hypothetical protein EYM_01315 [Ignicoccus islandicus DSM 13165]|uniref:Thaumarchaeal output domain-containing protein n=1 Tax=Ignicoccus islandicus DSM 13165 TaxID=940295 RepID=A0A0U3F852_9CREN|nr:hypothetical protein [Ignicoccus islandicus]ALU12200.1 hypothetical protein EYM_01315 [Ignicoccus islandicus DSM 13165]
MSVSSALPIPKEVLEDLSRDPIAKQVLITIFRAGSVAPQVGLESGVRYPQLDNIPNWKQVIEKLIKYNLVEREIADRLIHCPRCGSIHVASKLLCPWCKSFNIELTYIIQHTLCGYIDTETKFRDPNTGNLVCPKCRRPLRKEGLDYVVIGKVFECMECRRKTNKPLIVFQCKNCNHQFDYLNASYEPVYEYTLTPLGSKLVTSGALLKDEIIEALKDLGLVVESPGKERGRSGIEHSFDIIARTNTGRVLAIDFVDENDPSAALTSRMPKVLDTGIDRYVIILPSGALEASMFVQMKNVIVLDLSEPYIIDRIVSIARELLRGEVKTVEVEAPPAEEGGEELFFGEGAEVSPEKEELLVSGPGPEEGLNIGVPEEEELKELVNQAQRKERKEKEKKEEELLGAEEFFGG